MDAQIFTELRPVFQVLIGILVILLYLIVINSKILNTLYVFSVSGICLLITGLLYVMSGFIVDEYQVAMDGTSVNMIFVIFILGVLNVIFYIIKSKKTSKLNK
ncbi:MULTISPECIES: hypothetical protein [Bacillus]|uniref:Group-specific protein n=2 Tax=Bacillus cereus group TaxID=86661 RepID=A0A164N8J9_BACCE|nr:MULTISPECIES: hypothetical protein [Bacillus]KZD62899.1 hypothetical protein B4088_3508 [Bacillus cereus]NEK98433.1 hypothetical protein [Bacillus mobilis]TSI09938.1 hypothetical protein FOT98_23085 [Bacillus sp. HY001]SMD81753.1 hypothetical protein BACERE00185_01177 [Bacillus mobilis]